MKELLQKFWQNAKVESFLVLFFIFMLQCCSFFAIAIQMMTAQGSSEFDDIWPYLVFACLSVALVWSPHYRLKFCLLPKRLIFINVVIIAAVLARWGNCILRADFSISRWEYVLLILALIMQIVLYLGYMTYADERARERFLKAKAQKQKVNIANAVEIERSVRPNEPDE